MKKISPSVVEIEYGDTLSGIASKLGTTVAKMMKANTQITDPNKIYAGASLVVPSAPKETTPYKPIKKEPTPISTPTPTPTPKSLYEKYRKQAEQKDWGWFWIGDNRGTKEYYRKEGGRWVQKPSEAEAKKHYWGEFSPKELAERKDYKNWFWVRRGGEKRYYREEDGKWVQKSSEAEAREPFTSPTPTPAPAEETAGQYLGPSIVDYLKSVGQPSGFSQRSKLAKQYGITNYRGTAAQNTQLLNILRAEMGKQPSDVSPTPTPDVTKQEEGESQTYTVQTGDQFNRIARRMGVSPQTLRELNPQIKNYNLIFPGQKINLPPKLSDQPVGGEDKTIQDTLNKVSTGGEGADVPIGAGKDIADTVKAGIDNYFANLDLGAEKPERPDLVDQFKKFREEFGLVDAEDELAEAKTNLQALEDNIMATAEKIKGERVSSVVINRKLVKLDADTANAYREARLAVQGAQDRVQSKQQTINSMMSFTQQDYQNARGEWEFSYNKAISLYNIIQSEVDKQEADARANLEIFMGALDGSGKTFDDLTADEQTTFNDLVNKSGLSPTLAKTIYDSTAGNNRLGIYSNDAGGYDVLYQQPDGSIKVQSIGGTAPGITLAKDWFSDTQISKGAIAADMTITEFGNLSVDEANQYVYGEGPEPEEPFGTNTNSYNEVYQGIKNAKDVQGLTEDEAKDRVAIELGDETRLNMDIDSYEELPENWKEIVDEAGWLVYKPGDKRMGKLFGKKVPREELETKFGIGGAGAEAEAETGTEAGDEGEVESTREEINAAKQFVRDNPDYSKEELIEGIISRTSIDEETAKSIVDSMKPAEYETIPKVDLGETFQKGGSKRKTIFGKTMFSNK